MPAYERYARLAIDRQGIPDSMLDLASTSGMVWHGGRYLAWAGQVMPDLYSVYFTVLMTLLLLCPPMHHGNHDDLLIPYKDWSMIKYLQKY
jgi:hypothetical protein